jgi:hypothetical protein
MSQADKTGGEAAVLPNQPSFEHIVEESCERLWDKKVQHSIRRIYELDAILGAMEQELDLFLKQGRVRNPSK